MSLQDHEVYPASLAPAVTIPVLVTLTLIGICIGALAARLPALSPHRQHTAAER